MSKLERLYAKAARENPIMPPKPSSSCSSAPDLSGLKAFLEEAAGDTGGGLSPKVLARWWKTVCQGAMPNRHPRLLHARVAYELQARAYDEAGAPMPETVYTNLEAVRNWDVDSMTPRMKAMLKIQMKSDESPKRRMSDETKAKLREYSRAKRT